MAKSLISLKQTNVVATARRYCDATGTLSQQTTTFSAETVHLNIQSTLMPHELLHILSFDILNLVYQHPRVVVSWPVFIALDYLIELDGKASIVRFVRVAIPSALDHRSVYVQPR